MGYDRGDSIPFDFEPNGITFGSKSKGKLSPRSDPIQFERKLNTSFLSAILFVSIMRHVFMRYFDDREKKQNQCIDIFY